MVEYLIWPDQGISLTFLYLCGYYKFSRIGRPVLGRNILVNKENVPFCLPKIHKLHALENQFFLTNTSRNFQTNSPPSLCKEKNICITSYSILVHIQSVSGWVWDILFLLFWWAFSDYPSVCVCLFFIFAFILSYFKNFPIYFLSSWKENEKKNGNTNHSNLHLSLENSKASRCNAIRVTIGIIKENSLFFFLHFLSNFFKNKKILFLEWIRKKKLMKNSSQEEAIYLLREFVYTVRCA